MSAASHLRLLSDDRPRVRFSMRLARAIERRMRHALRSKTTPAQGQGVERALEWLRHAISQETSSGETGSVDAAAICAAGVSFVELGETEQAHDCWAQALELLRGDGALPDATGRVPSLFATAQFVRLANSLANHTATTLRERPVRAACQFLLAHIDRGGRLLADECSNSLTDRWALPLARLACLAPVAELARRWDEPHWLRLIERAVQNATSAVEFAPWTTPSHLWASAADALLDLGHEGDAHSIARWLDLAQRDNGAVATQIDAKQTSAWATAHSAAVWFALGNRERGDCAMRWLSTQQGTDGSFALSDVRSSGPWQKFIWATIHYLRAAQAQVRASFAGERDDLPTTIDRVDGRYAAVREWLRPMESTATILDVGCGSGRFLSRLRTEFDDRRWLGVDGSEQALAHLPRALDVERRTGALLHLPVADGECDAAYMVEALEHALVPRRAIEELCRSVRPGGEILIIDKCQTHQSLSLHEPWERWFTADEVTAWLAPYCDDVTVRQISHGCHQQPTGLFLCWTARRRGSRQLRRAA